MFPSKGLLLDKFKFKSWLPPSLHPFASRGSQPMLVFYFTGNIYSDCYSSIQRSHQLLGFKSNLLAIHVCNLMYTFTSAVRHTTLDIYIDIRWTRYTTWRRPMFTSAVRNTPLNVYLHIRCAWYVTWLHVLHQLYVIRHLPYTFTSAVRHTPFDVAYSFKWAVYHTCTPLYVHAFTSAVHVIRVCHLTYTFTSHINVTWRTRLRQEYAYIIRERHLTNTFTSAAYRWRKQPTRLLDTSNDAIFLW